MQPLAFLFFFFVLFFNTYRQNLRNLKEKKCNNSILNKFSVSSISNIPLPCLKFSTYININHTPITKYHRLWFFFCLHLTNIVSHIRACPVKLIFENIVDWFTLLIGLEFFILRPTVQNTMLIKTILYVYVLLYFVGIFVFLQLLKTRYFNFSLLNNQCFC